jgi:hypothetical protein
MRTLFALLVIAVVAGLGVGWARNHAGSAIHSVIDTSLPSKVEGTWTPLRNGHPGRIGRVRLAGGEVTSVRCHMTLGTYAVYVDHHFFFTKAAGRVPPRCPGRLLRAALSRATRVDLDSDGNLVFRDADHHSVTTLQKSQN